MSFHISIRASGYTATPAASVGFNAAVLSKKEAQLLVGQDVPLATTAVITDTAAVLRNFPLDRPLN